MAARKKKRVIRRTGQFKADLKRAGSHKKCDLARLRQAIQDIEDRKALPPEMLDHPLQGKFPRQGGTTDCRECHTSNDWLLVYRFPDDDSVVLIRTGTHSDLF